MSRSRAFTLIELLVVISIIAVLTAVLLPNLVGIRGRAADARKKADLKDFQAALRLYYNDHQEFPGSLTDTVTYPDINRFTNGDYSSNFPVYTAYAPAADGESYDLYVLLDNTADPDILASKTKCGTTADTANNYYVCAQ